MKYIIAVILFFIKTSSFAQVVTIIKDKCIGTFNNETPGISATLYNDNAIYLLTSSDENINGDKTEPNCDSINPNKADIWLLKLDTDFNIIWDKSIGGEESDGGANILNYGFGGIICSVNSFSDSSCDKSENNTSSSSNYWIVSIDSNGNKLWDKRWGGLIAETSPFILKLNSGNYVTCGSSLSQIGADKTEPNYTLSTSVYDYWLVKFDSVGNKIWDKVYGGTDKEYISLQRDGEYYEISLIADDHDSFVLAGRTESPVSGDISEPSRGSSDVWIVKIDSSGNKVWDKRFGNSTLSQGTYINHSNDGGYIFSSLTPGPNNGDVTDPLIGNNEMWVVKLDSLGNKIWDKRFGGNQFTRTKPYEIKPAVDGGYLICGTTDSDSSYDVSQYTYGATDYWILKIDENGNKLWDRRFGGPGGEVCNGMLLLSDTSIVLYGRSQYGISPVKTDPGKPPGIDYWLIHFKYTDTTSTVGFIDPIAFDASISLYPNPASDVVTIASNKTQIQNVAMYNLLGELIETKNYTSSHNIQFDLQTYPKGVYIAKITGQKNTSTTRKIIKL
jgi:hypothetical protein